MSVWRVIETAPVAAAALGWHQLLGPDFGAAAAFCLRETERRTDRVPCPHGCGCGHRVVPTRRRDTQSPVGNGREGEFIGVCDCDEPDCEDLQLCEADTVVWELDLAKLGRALARALEVDGRDTDLGVRRARQIAAFGGTSVPVVLTVQQSQEALRSAVGQLVARLAATVHPVRTNGALCGRVLSGTIGEREGWVLPFGGACDLLNCQAAASAGERRRTVLGVLAREKGPYQRGCRSGKIV